MVLTLLLLINWVDQPDYKKWVGDLGADQFQTRQAASSRLYKHIHEAAPYLQKYGIKSRDKERRMRSKLLLTYYASTIRQTKRIKDELPWIDMLPKDYPNRKKVINWHIDKLTWFRSDDHVRDWYHAEATREFVKGLVFRGQSKEKIVELLDEMTKNQEKWIEEHVGEYPWLFNELQSN
jgi:hypothetical protein